MPWLDVALGEGEHRLGGPKGKLLTGRPGAGVRARVGGRIGLEQLRRIQGRRLPQRPADGHRE